MRGFSSLLIAGSAFGLALAGSVTTASAHRYGGGCHHCRAPGPVYKYKTIYQHQTVHRVRNVSVSRTVSRPYHVYYVRRIQPIIHVRVLTRVFHHTYFHYYPVSRVVTEHLPPIRTVSGAVKNYYVCHCGGHY